MVFNTQNETFAVLDYQLPLDFLPIANVFVQKNVVYAIGSFMKSIDEQPHFYLDGAFVLRITEEGPRTISYVAASQNWYIKNRINKTKK